MSRKKTKKTKLNIYRLFLLIAITFIVIIGGTGIGFIAGALKNIPDIESSKIEEFSISSFVYDKDGKLVDTLHGTENRDPVDSLDDISPHVIDALLAIEDQRFYNHHGVDPYRIAGAFVANLKKGYIAQGGSTLTQQLVKISMLNPKDKSLKRKVQEAVIALKVENDYTKDEILKHYLNRVYFGHSAYGIEAAARTYFGKSAKDLEIEEAAMLAGIIQNPWKHSPILHPENAKNRRSTVLNAMVKFGKLDKEEANMLKEKPITLSESSYTTKTKEYAYQSFIDYVIDQAIDKLDLKGDETRGIYTEGYKFYTTLDPKVQMKMEEIYANPENFPKGKKDMIIQSAMVVLDPHTGEIKGLIGGRDQKGKRNFNRATQGLRQPGSVMKPIAVYGPALEKGYSPATVIDDFPETYQSASGVKVFQNYNHRYRGLISMRTAVQWSINTAAVKMLEKIGVQEGYKFAQDLGISTLVPSGSRNDKGLSLALGGLTKGVSPLELTAAYGAFANNGIYVEPHALTRIEDRDGNILWEYKTKKRVVMSPETAYLMTNMMETVVNSGTASRAKLSDRPVAGKTGTTSFEVDAWFAGYTPDLVGAVWLGYDRTEAMNNVSGGGNCAPIWRQVMEVAHKNLPPSKFEKPSDIVTATIDTKSGLLPSELTPAEYIGTEIFNKKFVPKEESNVWVEASVCPDSGQLLTPNCPGPAITKVFLQREKPWSNASFSGRLKGVVPEDVNLEIPRQSCTVHGNGENFSSITLRGKALMHGDSSIIKGAQLSWSWPEANENTIYKIYRSTNKNFIPNINNQIATDTTIHHNSYTDETIKAGEKYYYRIIAIDTLTGIQSPASNIVEVPSKGTEMDRALKPPKLQYQLKNSIVNLHWSEPHPDGEFNYFIFRSEFPGFTPGVNNQIGQEQIISSNSFQDHNVEIGKTYYYKVVAQDIQLNRQSPVSNEVEVIITE